MTKCFKETDRVSVRVRPRRPLARTRRPSRAPGRYRGSPAQRPRTRDAATDSWQKHTLVDDGHQRGRPRCRTPEFAALVDGRGAAGRAARRTQPAGGRRSANLLAWIHRLMARLSAGGVHRCMGVGWVAPAVEPVEASRRLDLGAVRGCRRGRSGAGRSRRPCASVECWHRAKALESG